MLKVEKTSTILYCIKPNCVVHDFSLQYSLVFMDTCCPISVIADLYADLVAPGLKCNLSVSTWQHSNRYDRNLNASCSGSFKVIVNFVI